MYDQVQPLLDAFDRPRASTAQVRDDVFAAGGARLALEGRRRQLAAVPAPAAQKPRVAALDRSLGALAHRIGDQSLEQAVKGWATAVPSAYDGRSVPLTPRHDRTGVRVPAIKGGWLASAGVVCGRTTDAGVAAAAANGLAEYGLSICAGLLAVREG